MCTMPSWPGRPRSNDFFDMETYPEITFADEGVRVFLAA